MLRCLLLFFVTSSVYANIEHHFKKFEKSPHLTSIRNVDLVYLINLDQRSERRAACLEKLAEFGIAPQRFSAIYGWHIPVWVYDEIGLSFQPGMWIGPENVLYIPPNGYCRMVRLGEEFYNKTVFSSWLTPGGVGCTMSHLSVLQDAFDSGYQTIWILEDDFVIVDDPHRLSGLIEQLDQAVGADGWDILYTDPDYLHIPDNTPDILALLPMKWRPDMPRFDLKTLLEHTPIGADFFKIGSRNRTHSLIIRRSGMEKILTFYKTRRLFLPYDHELAFIPHIRLFVTRELIVDMSDSTSDTKDRNF